MYVLVYASHGILGEVESRARPYSTHQEAYKVMLEEAHGKAREYADTDEEAENDYLISPDHATCWLCDPDAPEWHIFEVPGLFVPQEDAGWVKACLRDFGVGQTNFEASEMALDVCNVLKKYA